MSTCHSRSVYVGLKLGSVAMLVARCDHLDAATGNTMIMHFQPLSEERSAEDPANGRCYGH
jgi:hypothetical protein